MMEAAHEFTFPQQYPVRPHPELRIVFLPNARLRK
jgi:hypothetical protein